MPKPWREMSMKRLSYVLVLALVLSAQPVQADPITYEFYGVLAAAEWLPPGHWAEGPVTGSFTLDADAAQVLVDFWFWIHPMGDGIFGPPSCDVCAGSYAEFRPDGLFLRARNFYSSGSTPLGGKDMHLWFSPPDPASGSMMLRQETPPWALPSYIDNLSGPGGGVFDRGRATPPVPEPASLLLFGTGLVGLRVWRKRR